MTVGMKPIWPRTNYYKLKHPPFSQTFKQLNFFSLALLHTIPFILLLNIYLPLAGYHLLRPRPLHFSAMSPASNTTNHSAPAHGHSNSSITVLLTIAILIFFIVGFFAIYFCRCCLKRFARSWSHRHSPSGNQVGQAGAAPVQGLDPAIIKAFPSFVYSSVKEYRKEKYGLECAICLCEFQDTDILRLLTSCSHVFHQDCIDLWLECHQSCPVCRRTPEAPEIYPSSPDVVSIHMHDDASSEHSVSITIEDDDHEGGSNSGSERKKVVFLDCIQDQANEPGTSNAEQNEEQEEEEETEVEKFSRSKTTGHSIVKKGVKENKYTLILPDHVRAKLIRGHNVTRSDTTFGEFKSKTTTGRGGFGEVSELPRVGEVSELSPGDDNKV